MSIEESLVGAAAGEVAKRIIDAATQKSASKKKAASLLESVEALEAERLVLTIEVRCALLRECKKLLPAAIRQAKGKGNKPGSPALLRLISRLVFRNVNLEPRKK